MSGFVDFASIFEDNKIHPIMDKSPYKLCSSPINHLIQNTVQISFKFPTDFFEKYKRKINLFTEDEDREWFDGGGLWNFEYYADDDLFSIDIRHKFLFEKDESYTPVCLFYFGKNIKNKEFVNDFFPPLIKETPPPFNVNINNANGLFSSFKESKYGIKERIGSFYYLNLSRSFYQDAVCERYNLNWNQTTKIFQSGRKTNDTLNELFNDIFKNGLSTPIVFKLNDNGGLIPLCCSTRMTIIKYLNPPVIPACILSVPSMSNLRYENYVPIYSKMELNNLLKPYMVVT